MNKYVLEFDDNDIAILNAALIELPFKNVAPLIDKINRQISQSHNKVDE